MQSQNWSHGVDRCQYGLRFSPRVTLSPGFNVGGTVFDSDEPTRLWEFGLALAWH
jgi:hypothetical protein